MLTRPVAAVKFDLSSTPEQAACAMKIDEGLKTFWNVVEHMQHAANQRQPIHQVEEIIFRDLLVIGNWLLQAFLDMAGTGDVGPTLKVASDSPSDPDQNLPRLEQPHRRPYLSIFGEVDHRADLLRAGSGGSRPLGRATAPAATPVFVLAPAVAGVVRRR